MHALQLRLYLDTFMGNFIHLESIIRAVSSVGLERYLDRVEVTGSNPVQLTLPLHQSNFSSLLLFQVFFQGLA